MIIKLLDNGEYYLESDHDTFCNLHLKKNQIMSWLLWWIALMFAYIGLIPVECVFHGPVLVGSSIEVFKLFKPFHTEYIGFNGFITFSLEPPYTYRSLCPFPPGGVSLLSTPLLSPLEKYKTFKHVISFSI